MRNASLLPCVLALFLCWTPLAHGGAREECATVAASSTASTSLQCRSHDDVDVDEDEDAHSVDYSVRGGGGVGGAAFDFDFDYHDDGIDATTRNAILRFLSDDDEATEHRPFHVQGLRWHFMSLARDSRRLERLARRLSDDSSGEGGREGREGDDDANDEVVGLAELERAADYVINFNMAGFFRIQSGLFERFLREHLCEEDSIRPLFAKEGVVDRDVAETTRAFAKIVGKVEEYRVRSENIGKMLYDRMRAASDPSNSPQTRRLLLGDVTRLSGRLANELAPMRRLQETLIVPAVSRVVPSKVQKSFNNKVLRDLGLLESRLHLVGMHDAVVESGIEEERTMFEAEIPYVARVMIERWRRSLYVPRAGALDYASE